MSTNYDEIVAAASGSKFGPPTRRRAGYDDIIERHAARTGLDSQLIRAVIGQESGGNPTARSPKGAGGLMQLMPGTAARFGVKDVNDPEENIRGGTEYLSFLHRRYGGDLDKTLAAYNAGEGAVDKHGGIPPYKETQRYVPQVKARMGQAQTAQQPKTENPYDAIVSSASTQTTSPQLAELTALGERARQTAQPPAPPAQTQAGESVAAPPTPQVNLSAYDAAWHLGLNPGQAQRLTRRQARVLREAVAEDERKRAAGQQIGPPSLEYQNEMRKRAGLAPLRFNVVPQMKVGNITLQGSAPVESGVAPYYQPAASEIPDLNVPRINIRPQTERPFRLGPTESEVKLRQEIANQPGLYEGEEYQNFLRLNRQPNDNPQMRQQFVELKYKQAIEKPGSAENIFIARDVESARQQRVSQMNWPEYLAQAPKSVALGVTDTAATFMKGVAVLNKEMDNLTFGKYKKETTELPAYKVGEAIQREARNVLGSNPDLEQEILGQSAQTIGQVVAFVFGGWVSKAPKVATVILGSGLTAGDAYDEVRAAGGTDAQAVNAGLVAGALLGPTELFGLQGAMHAIENKALKATWRAALKQAWRGGRRDIVENVLQEAGQEWAQGEITGQRRTGKEIGAAALQGAVGGGVTIPVSVIANRPIKEARPIEPSADVVDNAQETPITLPENRPIVAEAPPTIHAQMDALTNRRGSRLGVLIPKGQSAPTRIPKGYMTTRTNEGVVIHPKELASEDVRELVNAGNSWQLLGHQNPDNAEATRVVTARAGVEGQGGIKPGTELMSTYVVPGQEQNAIEEMRAQFGPYEPTFEVGGQETAAKVVEERQAGWRPGMPRPGQKPPGAQATEEAPTATEPQPSRFEALSNEQLEEYITNTRAQMERRIAKAAEPLPKGTPRERREARPQILERQRQRAHERITQAQMELDQRRAGRGDIPSFEQWLETEAGGPAGGFRASTLTDTERATYQKQYDAQFYPKPHHSRFQQRRTEAGKKGQFAPGKVEVPVAAQEVSATAAQAEEPSAKDEGAGTKHPATGRKFSSTQVNLPPDAGALQKQAAQAIPDKDLAADGRETDPHITVKYGLHTEDSKEVEKLLADEPPIKATIGKVSIFPASENADYDVVKMDVDSPDLHRLNAKIAKSLKVTDTHPEYKPHVTLAYVKAGEGQKYIGKSNELTGKEVTLNSILFSSRGGQEVEIPLSEGANKISVVPTEKAETVLRPTESRRSTPKLNPTTDSLERAIRSLGGIKDDGSGEISTLKESGLRGLVSSDGRSAEDMAMALAEIGYGRDVWWGGSLRQGDSTFTGVNANDFIAAAIEDASGSKRHYSNAVEMDVSAEEEKYWRSQMEPKELEQWDASQKFLRSRKAQRLLGEVADGKGTRKKLRELRELGKRYGLEEDVVNEHIRLAQGAIAQPTAERDSAIPDTEKQATGDEGRPLTGEYVDESGTLRSETGEPLFSRFNEVPRSAWDTIRRWLHIGQHRVKREGNIIVLGEEAAAALYVGDEEMSLGWLGEFNTATEARARLARTAEGTRIRPDPVTQPRMVADLEKIRSAIQSALDEGYTSVVVALPKAARHEAFHASSFSHGGETVLAERHKDLGVLTNTPEYAIAARALLPLYRTNDPTILVEEIAARIADGKYRELELTREQAIDWMTKWFRSFVDTHGDVTVEQFKEMASDAHRALSTAIKQAQTGEPLFARQRKGAETEPKYPPMFSVEGNHVKLENSEAVTLLTNAFNALGNNPKGLPITGTFLDDPEVVANQLEELTKKEGAPALAKAIREAAKNGEGKVTIAFGEKSRIHERFHASSYASNRYLEDRHADFEPLTTHPAFASIRQSLTEKSGYPDSVPLLVEEGAAHIASGDYLRLGLSRKQAIDWLQLWFESFIAHNGEISISKFQEMAEDGQAALQRAVEAHKKAQSERTDEGIRGIQEGRESGTGEGRAPPTGTISRRPAKTEIVSILREHPLIKLREKVKRAFLVGSQTGQVKPTHAESDVDILLEVPSREGLTAQELTEHYRKRLQKYFVQHNIRGKKDDVHPQWEGKRVDVYFTYDADAETRPKIELTEKAVPPTESEAFKRWFGDSKVVDENGKPLVVYHGTSDPTFDKFKRWGGLGHWFGSTPRIAEQFAKQRYAGQGPAIYPVYLSISNPMVYHGWSDFVGAVKAITKSESIQDKQTSLRRSLMKRGYDGVVIRESDTDMGGLRDDWVAFKPEQIKSATGNRGTFDPNDPNILFSRSEDDYQGEHAPADAEGGAPLHDLNANGIYPDDVYGPNGLRYYPTGYEALDREAYSLIQSYRDHPGRVITVYRAVPKDAKGGINAGDWVTPIRGYAREHGKDNLGGDYKIQKKMVFARDLYTDGNSWLEWGYDPQPFNAEAEKQARERRQQRRSGEGPLFSRRPKDVEEKRKGSAVDRLRALAESRGQALREFKPKEAVAEKPDRNEAEKEGKPKLTMVAPPQRRAEPQTAERSFPKTAEAVGYHGGTDRDYRVLTNRESLERAERELTRVGNSRAAADLLAAEDPGAEDIALGILLMQRFEGNREIGRAVQIASHLSRKLTEAGQRIQAASIISRLSPAGVLLHAQRITKGKPLAEETAYVLVQQAKAVTEAEELIAKIQRERPDIFGPDGELLPRPIAVQPSTTARRSQGRRTVRATVGTLHDRLALMEQQARERMQARAAAAQAQTAAAPTKSQRGAAVSPVSVAADLGDLVIIGAAKLARKGITLANWMAEMRTEAPSLTPRDLRRLYRESYERYERERKQFRRESRERGAVRHAATTGTPAPATPRDYDRIIADRLDAQTAARKARAELAKSFEDLNTGNTIRTLRNIREVWNLSRALITSVDLSAAGRQGKMGLVTHPKAWLRGVGRQFKALRTKQFERMVSEMQLDPDYKYAQRFKLHLTSIAGTEEVFQSEFAGKIPWVKHSQQAYDTMLDTLRFGWFKAMLEKYRTASINLDDLELKEQFIKDTSLINAFTGRGGGRTIERVGPTLSMFYFSPRFWASRLKVLSLPLDPRMYGQAVAGKVGLTAYSKQARVDAWKTLFGFYGLMAAQIGIARLLGGVASFDPDDDDFIFNPDSADFLKVRFGNVHVDFSAGLQTHMRVAARLAKTFYTREFQKGKPRKDPIEILGQYSRSKEAPGTSLLHDLFFSNKKETEHGTVGTDFAGQPVFLLGEPGKGRLKRIQSSAIMRQIAPIIVQDALEAYTDSIGWKETTLGIAASVVGEGANMYKQSYSESREKWPMQADLDRLGITVNPPKRVKPGKYDSFKAESDAEYEARRKAEAAAIREYLQRLEGMSFFKKLPPQDQEAEIRATIKAARESVRYQQPAAQRKEQSASAPAP